MEKRFRGRAIKIGNNIETGQIVAPRLWSATKPEQVLPQLFAGVDPTLQPRLKKGDILVAGSNFGCGSSHEIAPLAIKWSGVQAIVAESFARFFYRNAINIGLPIVEALGVYAGVAEGEMVEVDLDQGLAKNISRMRNFRAAPFPDFMQTLLQVGGLEEYVRQRLKRVGGGGSSPII